LSDARPPPVTAHRDPGSKRLVQSSAVNCEPWSVFIVGELDRLAPNEVALVLAHPTTQGTVVDIIVAVLNNVSKTEEPALA